MSSEALMQNLEKKLQEKLQQQKESLDTLIKQKEEDFIAQMNQYFEKYRQNLLAKIKSEDLLLKNKLLINYRTQLSTLQEKTINDVLREATESVIELLEKDLEIKQHYYNKLLEQLFENFPQIEMIECPINAFIIIKDITDRHKKTIKINKQPKLKTGVIAYQTSEKITIYYTLDADIERMEFELRNQITNALYG